MADSAAARRASGEPIVVALSLALSRTQDDKGNVRWTLFGVSHDGPAAAFCRSFGDGDGGGLARFTRFATWAGEFRLVVVPSPSWPKLLAPQAQTVPSDLTARPWPDGEPYPAATCTTSSPAPMSPYRDLLVVVPSPS